METILKMMTSKKANDFSFVKGILLGLLILTVLVITGILPLRQWVGDFINSLGGYTQPEIAPNDYFVAEYVGFFSNGKYLDFSLAQVPSGCTKIEANKMRCKPDTVLQFYVVIKNTGDKKNYFYARPRVGFDCDGNTDTCKTAPKSKEWIDGLKPCETSPGASSNCETKADYSFKTEGDYRIFPGAKCLPQDCINSKNNAGYYAYTPKNFIDVEIKEP
jgi:hypothetical protein